LISNIQISKSNHSACCFKTVYRSPEVCYILILLNCVVEGVVPEGNAVEVEAGIPDSDPHWGVDVAFLKSTSMSYGPWVDRQRY